MKPTFDTKILKKHSKTNAADEPNAEALNSPPTCAAKDGDT
ncbi:hypothetical protein [Vibrio sp. 10N]